MREWQGEQSCKLGSGKKAAWTGEKGWVPAWTLKCITGTWDTTGAWSLACASDMQPKVYDSGSSMSLLPEERKTVPFGNWGPVSQVPEEC